MLFLFEGAPAGAGFAGVVRIGLFLQDPPSSLLLNSAASSLIKRTARLLRGTLKQSELCLPGTAVFMHLMLLLFPFHVGADDSEYITYIVAWCSAALDQCKVYAALCSISCASAGANATIVATSTLSAVTSASQAGPAGGHSRGHAAAIAVPVVLVVALIACKLHAGHAIPN